MRLDVFKYSYILCFNASQCLEKADILKMRTRWLDGITGLMDMSYKTPIDSEG